MLTSLHRQDRFIRPAYKMLISSIRVPFRAEGTESCFRADCALCLHDLMLRSVACLQPREHIRQPGVDAMLPRCQSPWAVMIGRQQRRIPFDMFVPSSVEYVAVPSPPVHLARTSSLSCAGQSDVSNEQPNGPIATHRAMSFTRRQAGRSQWATRHYASVHSDQRARRPPRRSDVLPASARQAVDTQPVSSATSAADRRCGRTVGPNCGPCAA